jgi:hypothetical protein
MRHHRSTCFGTRCNTLHAGMLLSDHRELPGVYLVRSMGMMIVAPFVIAPIAGILLALRFKVFVLIPASLLAAAVIVAISRQPKLTTALTVVGTVVLLQIGYIAGMIARALLQRSSVASSGDTFLKSIEGSDTWRVVGASKKSTITREEKRHLVQ